MNTVYFNRKIDDDARREQLYAGQLYVYAVSESTNALCQHARDMAMEAFAPYDPCTAQHSMDVEDFVAVLAELKPKFIHHPKSKQLIQAILTEFNCDLDKTYFDVPRLRTVTSDGYLTSGLGYAFKPHRDTWYSPPMSQLNWWLPVFDIESENCMAFHPHYWDRPIKNSSNDFNYQDWNQTGRKAAMTFTKSDTRVQSEALEELELNPEVRVVTEPGGLLIFSAAHLHSTVPNTSGKTRFSIDFRTVHLGDLPNNHGAPNIDSECSGTTIRDYLCGSDFTQIPDDICAIYENSLTSDPNLQSV
ncbi:MAG: hypothetical protein COA78_03105 [Blastopirellula sp.]|nr:MAG: hypothetical protein COA78_03105 [Blastopirellula sp.]